MPGFFFGPHRVRQIWIHIQMLWQLKYKILNGLIKNHRLSIRFKRCWKTVFKIWFLSF